MFDNKVAVITGGGSGIGEAAAYHLAEAGAKVAIIGIDAAQLDAVAEKIMSEQGEALALVGDISDYEAMQGCMQQTVDKWGQIDYLFANAGINGTWAAIEDLDIDAWQKTIDVNLSGTFYTIKAAYPHIRQQKGAIVVTSSINGTRVFSTKGATAYGCSKAAQVAMVKMLAGEFGVHGVRINVICPGTVDTQIGKDMIRINPDSIGLPVHFPQGNIPLAPGNRATAEQVAQLAVFLLSDAANHITGTEMWIDGGQSLVRG